jgi:uncharacterized protein (DUF305 family)
MQITINKKTGALISAIVVLLAVIGGLVLRGESSNTSAGTMGHSMGGMQSADSDLTSADILFLQMMIPHHQQAIGMSEIAINKSKDQELLSLAKRITTSQGAEIIKMKAWLDQAGAGTEMGAMGHSMSGMLSESDLAELKNSVGTKFDTLWLEGMIGHHDGAIDMTSMIDDAKNKEIKAFGLQIIADQSAEITQMKAMLSRI